VGERFNPPVLKSGAAGNHILQTERELSDRLPFLFTFLPILAFSRIVHIDRKNTRFPEKLFPKVLPRNVLYMDPEHYRALIRSGKFSGVPSPPRWDYAIKGMDGARPIWPRRAGKSRKLSRLERLDDRRRYRQGRHLCEAQSDHARAGLLPFLDRLSAGIFQPAKRSGRASCAAIPCATGSNRRAKGTRPSTAVCTRSPRCTRARFRGRSSSAPRRPNHRRGRHHRPRAAVLPRPLRHHQCPRRQSRFERRRIRFRMK
jgi:hypothetical protein